MRDKRLHNWIQRWADQGRQARRNAKRRQDTAPAASATTQADQPAVLAQPPASPAGPQAELRAIQPLPQQQTQASEQQRLRSSLSAVWSELQSRAGSADFVALLQQVFGPGRESTAQALADRLASGDQLGLRFELLSGSVMGGAMGAYAAAGPDGQPTVYINADWLRGASDADLRLVLLEEISHGFDTVMNGGVDTAGDEGQLFAALFSGTPLSAGQQASIAAENDQATLTVLGSQVAVEMANFNATTSTDTFSGGGGGDTFTFTAQNQIQSGDTFNGGGGSDSIVVSSTSGLALDFSGLNNTGTAGFLNMEALSFNNTSGTSTATFSSAQFGTGEISTSFVITGAAGTQQVVINLAANTTFSASAFTFTTWTSGTDIFSINGSTGAETITGTSQADQIDGGAGADTITGGAGADTITGGSGSDIYNYANGATALSIGGSGTSGTISGFDVILDFNPGTTAAASERIGFASANILGNTNATDGLVDSTLQLNTGVVARSHSVSNGIISFDDANTFSASVSLNSLADVAAAVQYLQANDFGSAGVSMAFVATLSGQISTFLYIQPGSGAGSGVLIELDGVQADSLSTSGLTNQIAVLDTTAPATTAAVTGLTDNVGIFTGTIASGSTTDDTSLVVTGTLGGATAGASLASGETLRIYDGSTYLGNATVTVNAGGQSTWSYADSRTLTNGTSYSYTARVADAAGNQSAAGTAYTVTVDTTAPTTTAAVTGLTDNVGIFTGTIASGSTTDDTSLVVTGTLGGATAGASLASGETLRIYDGSTYLGNATVTVNAGGQSTWSYTDSRTLTNGTSYSYTAQVADAAGNQSAAGTAYTVTVDTTAPTTTAAVTGLTDNVGIFTGTIASGSTTDDTSLVVTGTLGGATAGASLASGETLRIYDGSTYLDNATVTVNAGGQSTWSYADSRTLTNGTSYSYTARVADAAGNQSAAGTAYTVTVDTTAPSTGTLSLSNYTDNGISSTDFIATDRTFDLTLSGQESGASVVYQLSTNGGSSWSTTTAAQSNLSDGSYQFRALVTDAAGNTANTNVISLTVDTTAPTTTAAVTNLTDNGGSVTGSIASGALTDATTALVVSGTFGGATAGASLASGETLRIYDGGTYLGNGSVTVTAGGQSTWSFTDNRSYTNGQALSYTARVADQALNQSAAGTAYTATSHLGLLRTDTASPIGTLNASEIASGFTISLGSFNTTSWGPDALIAIKDGSGNLLYWQTAKNAAGTNVSIPSASIGSYQGSLQFAIYQGSAYASSSTNSGNYSGSYASYPGTTQSVFNIFSYHNTNNVIYVTSPVSGSTSADGIAASGTAASTFTTVTLDTQVATPTVALLTDSGTSSTDKITNVGTLSVTRTESGALVEYSANGTSGWSSSAPSLSQGSNTVYIRQTDSAGNISASTAFTFTYDTQAAAPTVALATDSGVAGDKITNVGTLSVTGTETGALVEYSANGTSGWSSSAPSLSQGSNTVYVRQTDGAGNISASTAFSFTYDNQISTPTITAVTDDVLPITGNVVNGGYTNDTNLQISGNAEANSTVTLYNGASVIGTATANGAGAWSINSGLLTDGAQYSFTTIAVDAAGNTSAASAAYVVNVDTGPPTAVTLTLGTGIADGATATEATAATGAVSIVAPAGNTVSVNFSRSQGGSVTKNLIGSGAAQAVVLSTADLETLGDGVINVSAVASDGAGNSSDPATATFTLDTSAPTVSISADPAVITSGESTIVSFNFSETPLNFSEADITVSGGKLSTLTADAKDPALYTATFTPNSDFNGLASINVIKQSFSDAAGNANEDTAALELKVEKPPLAAPILSLSKDTGFQRKDGITSDATAIIRNLNEGTYLEISLDGGNQWFSSKTASFVLDEGLYESGQIEVVQVDSLGNRSAAGSNSAAWLIDLTAPGFISGTEASLNENSGINRLVYSPLMNDSEAQTGNLLFFSLLGGGDSGMFSVDTFSGDVRLNINPDYETRTTYSFTLRATDLAGLGTDLIVNLTINDLDEVAPVAPTINKVATDQIINATEAADGVVVSGTAEALSSVSVTWGLVTKTVTSSDTGIWSVQFGNLDLPNEGPSMITAFATDAAGNLSAQSNTVVTIDRAAPGVPALSAIAGNDIINRSEKTAGVTLSGSAEAGSTISITWPGTTTRTTTADATTGAWSLTYTSGQIPADTTTAASVITVTATDLAGNVSTPISRSVVIDTAAPNAPLINTVAGNDIVNAAEKTAGITLSGTGEIGTTASITWGSFAATTTVNSSGIWSVVVPSGSVPADNASSSVSVTLTDAAGNVSSAGTKSVRIDTGIPLAPVINAVGGSDNTINAAEKAAGLTLSGTTDAENGSTVAITWGTVTRTTTVTAGSWSLGYTSAQIPADAAASTISAVVTDTAGNTSGAGTRSVVIDTVAPALTITALRFGDAVTGGGSTDTGVIKNDFITSTPGQTLNGTLSAALGAGDTVWVRLNSGGTTGSWIQATASGTTFSTSLNLGATDNTGSFDVQVRDAAGNPGATRNQTYRLDTAPAGVTISSFALSADTGISATDLITSSPTQTFSGTLSTNIAAGESVFYSLNGGTWTQASTTTGRNTWSFTGTLSTANGGVNTIAVRHQDIAGNASTASPFTVTYDATAPTLSSLVLAPGGADNLYGLGDVVTVTATFSESVIITGTPRVALNVGGVTKYATYTAGNNSNTLTFSYTVAAGDTDANGISLAANALQLNQGTIRDAAGTNALIGAAAIADQANAAVDTSVSISTGFRSSNTSISLGTNDTHALLTGSTAANLIGNDGNNILTGNQSDNSISGGLGRDILTGGGGTDQFIINNALESQLGSQSNSFDWIRDFEVGVDQIIGPWGAPVQQAVLLGAVSKLSNATISQLLNTTTFAANVPAAAFTFAGLDGTHTYLAVNNGISGFNAQDDVLVEITGYLGAPLSSTVI